MYIGNCSWEGLLYPEISSGMRDNKCSLFICSISRIYRTPDVSSIEFLFKVNVSYISSSCSRADSYFEVSSLIFNESLIRLLFITLAIINGSKSYLG